MEEGSTQGWPSTLNSARTEKSARAISLCMCCVWDPSTVCQQSSKSWLLAEQFRWPAPWDIFCNIAEFCAIFGGHTVELKYGKNSFTNAECTPETRSIIGEAKTDHRFTLFRGCYVDGKVNSKSLI